MKQAVVYGAGNIGRGFLGQLFSQSGWETVFIDINKEIVRLLNHDHTYPIKIVDNENQTDIKVENVRAVDGTDTSAVANVIANCDLMCTCVGVNVLGKIIPNLCEGIRRRMANGGRELNIILCENLLKADSYMRKLVKEQMGSDFPEDKLGFVEASVGRMVPVMNEEMKAGKPLKVWVEPFCQLPVDRDAFRGEIPEMKGILPESNFSYYIESKLFLHNMGHAITAYLGKIKGYTYIYEAIDDPKIRAAVQNAMYASAEALSLEHNRPLEEVKAYADDLIRRFGNRYLGDTIARVGRDLKRKLAPNDRLIGAERLCSKYEIDSTYIMLGIAAALLFGEDFTINDLEIDREKIKLIYSGLLFAS